MPVVERYVDAAGQFVPRPLIRRNAIWSRPMAWNRHGVQESPPITEIQRTRRNRSAISQTFLPAFRISPKVHDSSNNDDVVLDSVKQPVGKAAHATATVVFSHSSPSLGMNQNALCRPLDLVQKLQA